MQPIYLLTAVDVRRATEAGTSRATTIEKLTIPPIRFQTANHNPGGGIGSVDFTLPRLETFEPRFMVKGVDTDVFRGMGTTDRWTFAGAFRDKKLNKTVPARAIIEGAVTEWEPDESDPGEFLGCNHAVKEVTHFEFLIDGKEYWYFDFDERVIRRDGVDLFAETRQALGA